MNVLTVQDLQSILDAYSNAADDAARAAAANRANSVLNDFVNGTVDVAQDALGVFGNFLETFGTVRNERGERVLTDLGARATAKYEGIVNGLENQVGNIEPTRIYSMMSDENQIIFDKVSFGVFQKMGLLDSNLSAADMTPAEITRNLESVSMNDQQRMEYSALFVDAVINDRDLFESVPPKILADAYMMTKDLVLNEKDAQRREEYSKRFSTLATRIDFLIDNFSSMTGYYYADPSNIADVYAGYMKMFDVRSPDVRTTDRQNARTKEYNERQQKSINTAREKLTQLIAEYDELYHLTRLNPENADELKARWGELKQKLADANVDDETLAVAGAYRFLDADGNPIPQFLDENGNPALDWAQGRKLNPDGRLARVISLARNDVAMQNVGDLQTPVADMNVNDMLGREIPWKFAEISVPDQVVSGIAQNPEKFHDEKYVQKFWDDIKTVGGQISDAGYQAALDAQVNAIAGFAGELGRHIGNDKDVVMMPFQAVEDIDRLAATRTEKQGAAARKKKIGFFKRMAKNFGMAATMSAGLTFIGKATGVAYIGAAVGTTIGIGNMAYQGLKWRRSQKEQNKPYGIKDFFADKRNWGPAVASGLGVAAVISMATGNPELAAGFGLGAVGIGGGAGAAMIYNDAVNAGYSRGAAVAGAIGVMASGILGGLAGNAAMNGLVNYVNNNTDSTLFKHETVPGVAESETATQRVYKDGVIENNERILKMWEPQSQLDARIDGLMQSGLSHDDAVRYLMAFHDATDHNLGGGYFQSIGMSDSALTALRNSIHGTDVNLTPESLAAFEHFNPHISATNTVGYVQGAPVRFDLPANAGYDANGILVPGNDLYSTYVNHDGNIFSDISVQTPIDIVDSGSVFTPNELAFPAGIGTLGIYESKVVPDTYFESLRERAGALADRVQKAGGQDIVQPVPAEKDDKDDNGKEDKPDNTDNKGEKDDDKDVSQPESAEKDDKDDNGDKGREDKPDNENTDNSGKRGFFGWAKDTTHKIMRATKNGMVKTVRGIGEILDEGGKVHSKLLDRAGEVKSKKQKIKQEKQMADLESMKKENEIKLEKIRGQVEANMAKLEGEQRAQMKSLLHDIELAQKANASSADLLAARRLQEKLDKIDRAAKVSDNYWNSMAFSANFKGLFATSPEDVDNQKRKNKKDLLRQQGRTAVARESDATARAKKDATAESISVASNIGRRMRAFFTGMRHVEKLEIESAQNASLLAAKKAKTAKN